jgi:hypothetical protein
MFEGADVAEIAGIMQCKTKHDLEKYCRKLILRQIDFSLALLGAHAGAFEPYEYAKCFREWVPDHLNLTDDNLGAIGANGIGPLGKAAQKTMNKVSQIFQDRRMLAAHLFYTPDHACWDLFYFDQRDHAEHGNHWQYGPHIHLISWHWPNLELADVWERIQRGDANFPNKIHLRFEKPRREPMEVEQLKRRKKESPPA